MNTGSMEYLPSTYKTKLIIDQLFQSHMV